MPVLDQVPVNNYVANGATTVFPYTFKILSQEDLLVTVNDVVKTLTTDYTISGVGDDAGGNVTFLAAPANTQAVIMQRVMAYIRETDYQENGDFLAQTIDDDIDRTVLLIQQLSEKINRAILVDIGTGIDQNELVDTIYTSVASTTQSAADALASEIAAEIAAATIVGFEWKGAWVTGGTYAKNNIVYDTGTSYIALSTHVAGATFAADFGGGKWATFALKGSAGAGTGDLLAVNNLSEVNPASARINLAAAGTAGATFTGGVNTSRSSLAMHATTMNLFTQANIIDGTGSAVTMTDIVDAPVAGAVRKLYPITGTTITHGAVFDVDGDASYTTLAGDALEFEATTVSTFRVRVMKATTTASATTTKLITDTTDVALAVAAPSTQSNVGSTFSVDIPTSGFIRLASFAGRILNNATTGARYIGFGIRIGSTNYWFAKYNNNGTTTYSDQIEPDQLANEYSEFYGSATRYRGSTNTFNYMNPILDIVENSIPTGAQTVQLIAGYRINQITLKGTTKTTRVILEFVSV